MSLDFEAVCFRCRKYQHLGQDMGCRRSFGYGSNDLEGANEAADFALAHATFCGPIMIMDGNDVPEHFLWIPTDPMDSDAPGWGKGMPPELLDSALDEPVPAPPTFEHYYEVVLGVSMPLSMGDAVQLQGRTIGKAVESARPDPDRPGWFLVKTAVKQEIA